MPLRSILTISFEIKHQLFFFIKIIFNPSQVLVVLGSYISSQVLISRGGGNRHFQQRQNSEILLIFFSSNFPMFVRLFSHKDLSEIFFRLYNHNNHCGHLFKMCSPRPLTWRV